MAAYPPSSLTAAELQVVIPFPLCIFLHHGGGGIVVVTFVPLQLQGLHTAFSYCVTKHQHHYHYLSDIYFVLGGSCDLINIHPPFLLAFIEELG